MEDSFYNIMEDSFYNCCMRDTFISEYGKYFLYRCEETIFIVERQRHCFTMKFLEFIHCMAMLWLAMLCVGGAGGAS